MKYVIDLSGAKAKTEDETVRSLEDNVVAEDSLTYLASVRQDFTARDDARVVRYLDTELMDDSAHMEAIFRQVDSALGDAGDVTIASYLPRVGTHIASKYSDNEAVSFEHLARLTRRDAPTTTTAANDSTVTMMPDDEIVSHVVGAIGSARSGVVDQTMLRPLLISRDARFDKEAGPLEWTQQGFVGRIVELAVAAGLVRVSPGAKAPSTHLSLTTAGQRAFASQAEPGARREHPSVADREEGKDPKVQEWWDALASHGYGPFQQVRQDLYDTLRTMIERDPGGVDGINLIKQATRHVRETSDFKLPWQKVQEFLRTLLREELVLVANGVLISPRFGVDEPKIDSLADSFDLALDARLVILLVKIGGVVHHDDTWRLAAALYNKRSFEDRAEQVFLAALATGEVTIDPTMGQLFLAVETDPAA